MIIYQGHFLVMIARSIMHAPMVCFEFTLLLFRALLKACSKPCYENRWKGDKTCDDENNHCGCGWDGGDCCGTTKDYDYLYCTECKCLDPKNQPKLKSGQICDLHKKADFHCDPKNNHENCDFDGGDCCGATKDAKAGRSKYHFCTAKQILRKEDGGTGDCLCKVGISCCLFDPCPHNLDLLILLLCVGQHRIQFTKTKPKSNAKSVVLY